MTAPDVPLPFISRPENIARYEDGDVLILDRRAYPFERSFVRCRTFEDVARAIETMVTQSLGPAPSAGYGLAQAARASRALAAEGRREALRQAAGRLIATRPTNNQIRLVVGARLAEALAAIEAGEDPEAAVLRGMDDYWRAHLARSRAVGVAGRDLVRDGDTILTHCWADAPLVHLLREARLARRSFDVVCTETRPYLQGARLTADAIAELGVSVTIVTDAMPPTLMAHGRIATFIAGADRVTMDGHWINKVGTLALAIAAERYGVGAYAATYEPDRDAPTASDVEIEERDPEEVLHCRGVRTATNAHGVRALYPAFDVTPPDLATGFILDRGVFGPGELASYFERPEILA